MVAVFPFLTDHQSKDSFNAKGNTRLAVLEANLLDTVVVIAKKALVGGHWITNLHHTVYP